MHIVERFGKCFRVWQIAAHTGEVAQAEILMARVEITNYFNPIIENEFDSLVPKVTLTALDNIL